MANRCEQCKFYAFDCVYNNEDYEEYEVEICKEDHDEYLDSDEECPFFKEFKAKPYVEKDTECDECEFLQECIEKGNVLDATRFDDMIHHYIRGIGCICKKRMMTK